MTTAQERAQAAAAAATAAAAEAEINKMRELEERIKAPSIWAKIPCGIRFEDLQDTRYEEAVRFIKKHYLNEEITWRSAKILEDKEATDEFIHNVRIWLKDKMSIAVIKEGKEKLVGLLIMRIQDKSYIERIKDLLEVKGVPNNLNSKYSQKTFAVCRAPSTVEVFSDAFSRTFSRVKMTYNPTYTEVMKFYNAVEQPVNLFTLLDVNKYLKVYIVAVKARYRHRGIVKELMKASQGLAASAFIPAMVGIFTTGRMHQIAEELGFQKYNEIYYIRYLVDYQVYFWDAGEGNYGAAIMGYRIPGIEEKVDIPFQHSRLTQQPEEEEEEGKEAAEK